MTTLTRRIAEARRGAREAMRAGPLRVVARSGYVASALLRGLIGVLALALAAHVGRPHPDASGAFGLVAEVPGGIVLLVLVAIGNFALGVWLIVRALLHRDPQHRLEQWRQRSVYAGRAAVYLIIGSTATRFVLGVRRSSERSERQLGRVLLDLPGGAVVLGLIGGIVLVVGVGMMWVGALRRFERTVHLPDDPWPRRLVQVLGVVGYVLQGASIAVVGFFVVLAAFTLDPERAAGLSGTLLRFADSGWGRLFLVAVGVGWIVAGLYALIRARIARLTSG